MAGTLLRCPIRGNLVVPERAADGLTYTEEKRRIDCIRFLLAKGYPASHFKIETTLLRFGNQGRNSFRTDLAVLDAPVSTVPPSVEAVTDRVKLIAEIKREHSQVESVMKTQVYPAMAFLRDLTALGAYWDDVEQRLLYRTLEGTRTKVHETTLAVLPAWGQALGAPKLRNQDLLASNLLELFIRIEDRLHTQVADHSQRFEIMLQLLLVKLFDEFTHPNPLAEMTLQDFTDAPLGDADVVKVFNGLLTKAVQYYGKYLPKPVETRIALSGAMLKGISALLAPTRILGLRRDVIQSFYMYFAKGVYKWDLAQYFTPSEVVDFIVSLTNPRLGDQIKDPACGSGDFLISSFHYGLERNADLRDAVWGADNSENAVQVCVLNMVLNGDGKGNIAREDSLGKVDEDENQYSVLLCNPPFGVKIQERRFDVLRKFDLGRIWSVGDSGIANPGASAAPSQEVGLLFAELCVRQATPGGRIGIILPNGYLGNKGSRYTTFREWLLRHVRLVAVVAFPRFTFKKSGADVSASVLLLEKREAPLEQAAQSEDYPFYTAILESVGWSVAKTAERIYRRDPETGAYLTDDNNERLQDADFERALAGFLVSPVVDVFPWVTEGRELPSEAPQPWSVSIRSVLERPDLSIDPKRWSERACNVRSQIKALPHLVLGDVVDVIPQTRKRWTASHIYQYVEMQDVSDGLATPTQLRGWQLPDRARHIAERKDIFIGSIWGSVGKWFVAGGDCHDLIVSNGFHRVRMKPGKEAYIVDVIAALNTEDYRIQARSLCTGSDGLAELGAEDLLEIVIPEVTDPIARDVVGDVVDALVAGRATVASVVKHLHDQGHLPKTDVHPRGTNWVQV